VNLQFIGSRQLLHPNPLVPSITLPPQSGQVPITSWYFSVT